MKKNGAKKEKISLNVEKRNIFGKKVKQLRSKGYIPANIYGEKFKSTAISVKTVEFSKVLKIAGETQIVYISLDNKEIPTIIHNVQKHPVTGSYLHADFRKVDLKEKIETNVPLRFIGSSEAVEKKKGDLLKLVDQITIKALPTEIPSHIDIDLSSLKEIDDAIYAKDVLLPSKEIEIVTPPDTLLIKIASHKEEAAEPAVAPAEEKIEETAEEKEEDKETLENKE